MSMLKEQYLLYKVNTHKDPEAFAALYDLYIKQIYQFIFFKVKRKEDAEDLTANAFLKAWRHFSEGHQVVRNFRAFIYTLARNLVIDFYRQQGRQESLFFEGEEEGVKIVGQDVFSEQAFSDDKRALLKALDSLKTDYKEILVLRFIEGLSFKEIAQIINKSQVGSRVLAHRAMKALKEEIKRLNELIQIRPDFENRH